MTEEITKQNTLVPDAVAGLTTGIANIPDAMASAILAGVGPRLWPLCLNGGHARRRAADQLQLHVDLHHQDERQHE